MFVRQAYIGRDYQDGLISGEVQVGIFVSGEISSPGHLWSGFDAQCPASFAESAEGLLLIANGTNPMLRWDGVTRTAIPAGVKAPVTPLTFYASTDPDAGNTHETIEFNFAPPLYSKNVTARSKQARQEAWDKYQDRIRATFMPDGVITTAYQVAYNYFFLTSINSGPMLPPTVPAQWIYLSWTLNLLKAVDGGTPDPINGRYIAFYRYRDKWGNPSNPSPLSSDILIEDATEITYENIVPSTESRVLDGGRLEIWRTTAGEGETFFKDVDTDDFFQSTYRSRRNDEELEMQESIAVFNEDGDFLAGVYGVPPSSKPYVASFDNQMAAAGDRPWRKGMVSVTFNSATVTGYGTGWLPSMKGRFFYTPDVKEGIEVLTVSAESITLVTPYQGPTDGFLPYAIRADASRSAVFYSEPSSAVYGGTGPESWNPLAAISIPENNDEQTGMYSYRGYPHLLKRRGIHRLFFDSLAPPKAFPVIRRGAVNQQCAVEADGTAFILDELGVHAFNGETTDHISGPVQDLFRNGIFWGHMCRFHGVHTPDRHLIRWFICLSGVERPRHALCFHYRLARWWVEEFPMGVTASVLATVGNKLRPVVALEDGNICALDVESLDLVDGNTGTTRFSPTEVGMVSVTTSVTLPSSLTGVPIGVCSGAGRGQWRIITDVTSGVITVDMPWTELPTTTSVLQVGGIRWTWKSGHFERAVGPTSTPHGTWLQFESTEASAFIELRTYRDASPDAEMQAADWTSDRISALAGDRTLMVQLQRPDPTDASPDRLLRGACRANRDFFRDSDIPALNSIEVELAGFSGTEQTVIRQITIPGARSKG